MIMKFQTGDIVTVKKGSKTNKAIVSCVQGWYLAKGLISVHYRKASLSSIVNIGDCTLHTPRCKVKKWWLWL